MADASSALYTRYPEGLASALEKLGASTAQLQSANQASAPMYIINPFRKKGRAASDLTSTHPPISERIRILRLMVGGASFVDYDHAFRDVHKDEKGILPSSVIASASTIGLRSAETEAMHRGPDPDKVERARNVSDLLYRLNNYRTVTCDCGTTLKLPPKFKGDSIKCPHCGRINSA